MVKRLLTLAVCLAMCAGCVLMVPLAVSAAEETGVIDGVFSSVLETEGAGAETEPSQGEAPAADIFSTVLPVAFGESDRIRNLSVYCGAASEDGALSAVSGDDVELASDDDPYLSVFMVNSCE